MQADDMVRLFQTDDCALLPVIKGLLDNAGIPYIVQGEHALGMMPLGPFGAGLSHGLLGAIVLVRRDREEEARALLAALPAQDEEEMTEETTED